MSTRSLNKVMLIGNLTRDVELRYTSSGTSVASFGLATNRSYKDSTGKDVESAEFTNIVAWSKLGEICSQLLKKGMKVYIEGRLQTSSWQDKETGKTMKRTEVVATDMLILTALNAGTPDGGSLDHGAQGSSSSGDDFDQDVNFQEMSQDDDKNKDKS